MSQYPEVCALFCSASPYLIVLQADEAQHRHYNDGYSPYPPTTTTPSPYTHYDQPYDQGEYRDSYYSQPAHTNPFSSPPPPALPPLGGYPSSQPPHDPYTQSPYAPHTSPPPQDYLETPYHTLSPPPGAGTPSIAPSLSAYGRQSYALSDPPPQDDGDLDEGDIPLLNRNSHAPPVSMPVPGGNSNYGGFEDDGDDGNFIRYGRIPQRVPRRYKTVKRVE